MKINFQICLIVILFAFSACSSSLSESTQRQSSAEESNENSQDTSDSSTSTPVLFGFWGLNGLINTSGLNSMQNQYGMTVFQVASGDVNYTVNTLLPLVKSQGLKITLRLAGSHADYTDSSGNFDVDLWKDQISIWQDSGIQAYIDDGTLVGHMLLDDIFNFSGQDATANDLDEMARYSKEILPGLMTFVRERASSMPTPASGTYNYVDAVVNQYRSSDGDVSDYLDTQIAVADSLGVDIINGLNICDGGDGSSGQVGWRSDKYAMSANEIYEYGQVLLSAPDLEIFLMWEFDTQELWADGTTIGANVFSQSDYKNAFLTLSEIALGQ